MKKAYAVIGAMFGDEGKGNVTDVLCAREPNRTINIRMNGGAQASHTVVSPYGKYHAFRHFGSGSFELVPTYLSKEFLVNIFIFDMEHCELSENFGIVPEVYVNPDCRVTTFWDIAINQLIERRRGENRHGSCGLGIDETVQRSKDYEYRVVVSDFYDMGNLFKKLSKIQKEYVPMRLKNQYGLEMSDLTDKERESLQNEKYLYMTLDIASVFMEKVSIADDSILKLFDVGVFEGAQGLQLDQNNKKFSPYLTTSNTGIKNMMRVLSSINFSGKTDIYYISRVYATRHGRGEFPTETLEKPYKHIVDLTNIPNEFQESLRFGILDMDLLLQGITDDLKNLIFPARKSVVFTCFDQLEEEVRYSFEGKQHVISKSCFLDEMRANLIRNIEGFSGLYITQGNTRHELIKKK